MSNSAQVAVVRRLYEARGNPEVIRQVLAPDVRWEVVEGFPYSGVYVGLDDVLRNFFGRLFQDFESFVAVGTEFFESGDRVIALGSYAGRAEGPARVYRSFRSCVDLARWVDRAVATVCRYRSAGSCIGWVVSGGGGSRPNESLHRSRRWATPAVDFAEDFSSIARVRDGRGVARQEASAPMLGVGASMRASRPSTG